ncbi:hypothetical protein [[Clostridium] polysaccharolyticum]|uniref:Uncharacterized protein n=1 Tax=[Clostridium] polysaccharolyticum TaxID=29364 RepID=A0A1H9Y9B2_9FIRM|nr:hypothetical protein [[Clostridium] polysaccharolyticum]SES65417.1 hypothetical protein SAMN04487772_101226 [[Clostridium] polysaccharolyticum]
MHESDYIFLIASVLIFIDGVRFVLKIAGKTVNENVFLGIMLSVNPIITFVLFLLSQYTNFSPGNWFVFDESKSIETFVIIFEIKILYQRMDDLFYEELITRLLEPCIILVFIPIFIYKSICRLNAGIYAAFAGINIVYIILICYYMNKKRQDDIRNVKNEKMDM